MVEYPIQKRWPYEPRLHRCMNSYLTMYVMAWYIMFGDKSADYIRTWVAWQIFQLKKRYSIIR